MKTFILAFQVFLFYVLKTLLKPSPSLSLSLSFSLSYSVLCLKMCTKAEFSSSLFKISTNLGEGQRSCKFWILQDKKKKMQPHTVLSNTSPCHSSPTQWPFFVPFWKEPISGTFIRFCLWMKAIILTVSQNFHWQFLSVYLNPQGARPNLRHTSAFT